MSSSAVEAHWLARELSAFTSATLTGGVGAMVAGAFSMTTANRAAAA